MPVKTQNPLLGQPLEVRMWVETNCREDLTNAEILTKFNEKFPWITGVTVQHVAQYRKKYVPFYKDLLAKRYGKEAEQLPEGIEGEILEIIAERETDEETFTSEDDKKIDMLKAEKYLLRELYQNYQSVKTTADETAKRSYLVELKNLLKEIRELQGAERSFLSAVGEIRKAEEQMTIEQYYDSITGWSIPRMLDKSKDKTQSLEYISKLKSYLDVFRNIINTVETQEEVNREILKHLYVKNRVKEDNVNETE